MKLRTRVTLWMLLLLTILVVNTLLGLDALQELRRTDSVIQQDYELALHVRRTRSLLLSYHDSALTAALTRSKDDASSRDRYRQILINHLQNTSPFSIAPSIQDRHTQLHHQISHLIRLEQITDSKQIPFLNPPYREHYTAALRSIEGLEQESFDLVLKEKDRDDVYYKKSVRLNLIVFSISLIIIIIGMIYFRRKVLNPVQKHIEVLEEVRKGNLNQTLGETGNDEIGVMGRTLDSMIHELEIARRERIEFIGSVAHDLKNPLTSIIMNCDLALRMEKYSNANPTAIQTINRIRDQSDRLKRLTEDLLEAAKEGRPMWTLKRSKISLNSLIQKMIHQFTVTHPDHTYSFVSEQDSIEVHADPDRMRQMLENLISNATKYSPKNSSVEVVIRSKNDFVYLEVRDRGIGILDDQKVSIFEAFSRLDAGKRMSAGTGLGLAIVKDIITAHGGTITVHDRLGGGTVFMVTLPVSGLSTSSSSSERIAG